MNLMRLSNTDTDEIIKSAISVLSSGGIVAYPTETLYGLGVKYDDEQALKRLFGLKKRPMDKTVPIIIGSVEQLSVLAECVNNTAADLIARFWPGPLTLIFRAQSGLNTYITSGRKVAVRIPGESFALRLVRSAGFPITATSANISGMPPARNAAMISGCFNEGIDLVVDGGGAQTIVPSTIVDVTESAPVILREGALNLSLLFTR